MSATRRLMILIWVGVYVERSVCAYSGRRRAEWARVRLDVRTAGWQRDAIRGNVAGDGREAARSRPRWRGDADSARGSSASRGLTACDDGSAVGARRFEMLLWGLPEGGANPRFSGRCAKWSRTGSNRRPLACHNPAHGIQDALTTLYRGFAYCKRCKHSAALREFASGCAVYTALRACRRWPTPTLAGPPSRSLEA